MSDPVRSILVYVGLDLLGDGLIKLPFVRALRSAFPQAHITWLAGKGHSVFAGPLAPLVADLIDEVVDNAGIGDRPSQLLADPLAGSVLAGRHFDLVIDSQRRLPDHLDPTSSSPSPLCFDGGRRLAGPGADRAPSRRR